jgi:hypothetical protein
MVARGGLVVKALRYKLEDRGYTVCSEPSYGEVVCGERSTVE